MTMSVGLANRLGFIVLGLTNNFAYVIMLSAAYDLLNQVSSSQTNTTTNPQNQTISNQTKPYCNEHSTSTILLADTIPSLTTKLLYPFLLVSIPTAYKAIATALLTAAAFIITGLSSTQILIFTGVICASLSSGLGEATYLSNTPLYGDVSLSGWSMGTGAAGLLGAAAYALLRMVLKINIIMIVMLVVPVAMLLAFFYVIVPIDDEDQDDSLKLKSKRGQPVAGTNLTSPNVPNLSVISGNLDQEIEQERAIDGISQARSYGTSHSDENRLASLDNSPFDFNAKLRALPSLAKYFLPLLLVYFAEYFINQGLFELVYYPEITFLDHAAQYRWFQVSYQLGVMISRSSLDLFRIKNLWTMSLLQAANAILFLAHASKLIHIPSFYIVIALIIYEGLLGGFTYVNTFYRVKKEVKHDRQEFCISTVTLADSLGIVMAGLAALPIHNSLCKLYS